jgi:hypothetical protein
MSRGGIDASLFTSAGSNIGANIGGGLSKLGTGIGGMLQSRADAKNKEAMQAEVQKELQQYANDPAQLNAMGQKYQSMGKEDVAKAFYEAAKQATTKRTAQVSALETGGQDIQKEAQRKRAVQVARQKGDQDALTALNARAMDPAEYLTNKATAEPKDIYKVVGNRIFNTEAGEYIEPSKAAELIPMSSLKDVVTPESLIEYAKTGDPNVLDAIVEDKEAENQKVRSQLLSTDNVLNTVKEASGLSGEVYPVLYDVAKFLPTTDARQLSGRVDTLKSALSFDRLQQMRDQSKTGGALGNVSNVELGLLGANVAALDPASGDFAQQLQKVEMSYTNFKNALLGKKPVGDRYVENEGILYYVDDNGDYVSLGKL